MDTKEQALKDYTQRSNVKEEVYLALQSVENASDMELSHYIGRERNYITRARTDLINDGLVKKDINRHCNITGSYVQTWKLGAETNIKNWLSDTQMNKVHRLITQMNEFQKIKVKGWLQSMN